MTTPTQSSDLNDLISARGAGGEIHQHADDAAERLTTAQGVVIADNQNSLRAGAPGPTLLEDFALREKIFHFDHERIPERVVHARGYPTIDRRSDAKSTLTAFFDDHLAAERAVERLRQAGVPDESVRMTEGSRPDADSEHRGSEDRGFFEKLGDFFFPDDDRSAYAEGLSRGGYLVTATRLAPDLYDTALAILDDDGAVDIEERTATWRAEGWTGNYTDLHDPEGLLRTRTNQADLSNDAEQRGNDRGRLSSYDAELSANHEDDNIGDKAHGREASPAAAAMAAAASGVLIVPHSGAHASTEGPQTTTDGESGEVIEARRYGERDMSHGRTRVRSYLLDEEDGDTDTERPVEPLTERDINRP